MAEDNLAFASVSLLFYRLCVKAIKDSNVLLLFGWFVALDGSSHVCGGKQQCT